MDLIESGTRVATIAAVTVAGLFAVVWARFPLWRRSRAGVTSLLMVLVIFTLGLVGVVRRLRLHDLADMLALPGWTLATLVIIWRLIDMLAGRDPIPPKRNDDEAR